MAWSLLRTGSQLRTLFRRKLESIPSRVSWNCGRNVYWSWPGTSQCSGRMRSSALPIVLFYLLTPTTRSYELSVSPKQAIYFIGDDVNLTCFDASGYSLDWNIQPIGARERNIFTSGVGISVNYRSAGRHSVEVNAADGSSLLHIRNISMEDAGTYICSRDDGSTGKSELTVLGGRPKCTSNTSLTRVLVENDCGVEPDHLELNCSVACRGNISYLLEWHHSSKSDVEMERYVINRRTSVDNFVAMHFLTVKLDWKFNGTNFVCSLKDVMTRDGGIGCATRNVSVMYFFITPPTHVVTEYGDSRINVSCVANTSESCSYRWQARDVRTNNPIDIHRQKISLTSKYYDDVKCFAECRLRNRTCTTQPMDLKHSFAGEADTDGDLLLIVLLLVMLIISLAVVITVGFICFRESGSFRDLIHKKRRHECSTNGDQTEMQRLNPSSVESVTDFIRGNVSTLVECLDTENGFAECLLSKSVLNADQCDVITNRNAYPSYRNQNKTLLLDMILPNLNSESIFESFMEALIETDQRHIFNFINHSGETVQQKDVQCRILSEHELQRIDRHMFLLVSLLEVDKNHLLDSLVDDGCITERHRDSIDSQLSTSNKNRELLSIIRRRSYSNFVSFIDALKRTKQDKAAQLLEQQTGGVVPVHCEISAIEGDAVTSSEDIKEIETKISELLNITRGLSRKQKQSVARRLKELSQQYLIHLMAAYPTGSIVVYFLCQTFRSIVVLKGIIDSGQMKNILEDIFNCILKSDSIRLKLDVSPDLEEYQKRIQEARTTIYLETEPTKLKYHECYMRSLPREMLELILLESMIGIMSAEWMATVRDNESVSGRYNLYETVANKTWMSAYIGLNSVSYQWMHVRYLKKGEVLKRFFFQRLHEHYTLFSEQLNCRYVFVDCLQKEGIIKEEERRNIMEADGDVATRTYEDIPESCWPQTRDSEQMLMSNQKLLKCLFEKNYSQISKFLKLMEDNSLTHILNYFINIYEESFGDVWPLRDAQRNNLIKNGTSIVRNMNILALSEVRGKKKGRGEESGTSDGRRDAGTGSRHPSETTQGYDGSATRHPRPGGLGTDRLTPITEYAVKGVPVPLDVNIHLDTTIDEIELDREVPGTTRDRQNLIDLLYNEGCISLPLKQHIEQQPTQQLQNLEMLQLIKNGSIKTFKVALEFFRATNQDGVFDMLNRKYFSEEIQSSQKFIRTYAGVTGVAWLEENIYVVTYRSNIVYVYPDQESIDGSEDGKIELKGKKNPRDMVASKLSRSIFISDDDNRCLWRIQMPGREISRREVDGTPYGMSISSSDVLIVHVILVGRVYLNLYRSSDVMLMKSVPLSTEIRVMGQVVQLSNGHFIVHCSMEDDPDVFLIRELSFDGRNFIRNFDPRSIASNLWDYWTPFYLSIDEDENIFIADQDNDRVVLLNSRWTDVQILLNRDQHSIESPGSLCYVREKQQLIVGRGGREGLTNDVRVFNLCSHVPHTDRRTLTNELELIKSVPFDHVESRTCDTSNPSPRMPDIQLVKRFEVKEGTKESSVGGVIWLENKIYVVCRESNRVHVFPDQKPFDELKEEKIKIERMKHPWDMSASKNSRSIFISDPDNLCLWRVQMPGGEVSRWKIDGSPHGLSITSSDELIVMVDREDRWHLDMFSCSDVNRKQSIPLSAEIKDVRHAVQSSNDNVIILHSTKNFPDVYQISELPIDGTNFIRTFDPRSAQTMNLLNWSPNHLSFDDDGRLFVVDHHHKRVYLLSSQLTDLQILLKRFQHQLIGPYKLCYVREKQQLIVGQTGMAGEPGLVSVFNVPPQQHPMSIEHEQEPNNEQ